ncbi:MAG: Unknown protein [uncultured Sulfurovum sp.]|uniref:Uncharacterized protein n=1 Tax=uncultured Sulfurovum sp. TaxID=269237 RepID=A0A6S6S7Z2_9BACT|nr:MAG: Unknown protein [uncultured Sulfurovum sp.]
MLTQLNDLKPNRPKATSKAKKRILCILEGSLELEYVVKVFKLFGYGEDCFELTEEYIRVAWGKKLAKHQNIVKQTKKGCTFEGGSHKGSKVPFPAISAFELYNRDIEFFDSVIIFFDADKDIDNEVENYFKEKLESLEIENTLLVSLPCFESTLIDFCTCGNCREEVEKLDNTQYPCDKYKNNFSSLTCFTGSKHLIVNLKQESITNLKTSKLVQVNKIIQNYMSKQ